MVEFQIRKLFQKPQNLGIGAADQNGKPWTGGSLPNRVITSSISPFEPFSYMIGFFIVIGVSMIKDAMEDYKRHCDDTELNNTKVEVVRCIEYEDNSVEFLVNKKPCEEIQAGDYLIIRRDEEVFADVVLLRSKVFHKDHLKCTNHCFVQTSSLDGESNLKKKNAIESPKNFSCCKQASRELSPEEEFNEMNNSVSRERKANGLQGTNSSSGSENMSNNSTGASNAEFTVIDPVSPCYEHFFSKIHSFDLKDTGDSFDDFACHLNIDGKLAISDSKNVILRGSKLKNTEACLCLVVGVGSNTKLTKSLDKTKRTKTLFDERMNYVLLVVLGLYITMMFATIAVGIVFTNSNSDVEYLNIANLSSSILTIVFSNYILYIYLIPLSLYVMLEVARLIHQGFIAHDSAMEIDGIKSKCRNSNVIEDLGVIDYILTDKTGTITKNSMTLRQVHVDGASEICSPDLILSKLKERLESSISNSNSEVDIDSNFVIEDALISLLNSEDKINFLMTLTMLACNSVEILNQKPEGISQEEICFLETTTKHHFRLAARSEKHVVLDILNKKIKIKILGMREFTSRLQRMSVVLKIGNKTLFLIKGSDQKLLSKEHDADKLKIIDSSLDFRSLVFKYKELSEEEEEEFLNSVTVNLNAYDEDNSNGLCDANLLQERKEKENQAFNKLEKDSLYLGTVFIEDEIQDEVCETMKSLREAGLKIWMVTGDKKETAIACARSSCLIESNDFLAFSGSEAIEAIEKSIELEKSGSTTSELQNVFNEKSLVIYRATPSQKGKIASMVIKSGKHTLAIGDGNNDIGMLLGSNVGIGVIGKEGTQAAMAGDFAVPQFKVLKNLLFVHGRFCFQRYTFMALNGYYKNIVFIFVQFIYNLFNGASARPLYSNIVFNYFNLFFTSSIAFSISIFDKDISRETALQDPVAYRTARFRFSNKFIFSNILFAIFEASLIFFFIKLFAINDVANSSGMITGHSTSSILFSIIVVYSVLLRQWRSISFRVIYSDLAIGFALLLNLVSIIWIDELYQGNILFDNLNLYLEEKIDKS